MTSGDRQLKSNVILDELKKRQHTKDVVNIEEETVKVVIFTCCGKRYAFYGTDIREILPACEISWVPGLPAYLPGLINVRGDIESVIDIRHFLGETPGNHGSCLVAIAVRGNFQSGILIESIEDVIDVPQNIIHPPLTTLNGAARDLVAGEIDSGGDTVSLLDVGKLASLISL